MRHRSAERADEQDPLHPHLLRQAKNAIAIRPPVQVRLLADEQHQPGRLVAIERAGRHGDALQHAFFDLDIRPEQGRHFHGTGEVVDVERLGIDLGDLPGTEQIDQPLDRAGRHVAAVHPAREGKHQRGVVQGGAIAQPQEIVLSVRHESLSANPCCATPLGSDSTAIVADANPGSSGPVHALLSDVCCGLLLASQRTGTPARHYCFGMRWIRIMRLTAAAARFSNGCGCFLSHTTPFSTAAQFARGIMLELIDLDQEISKEDYDKQFPLLERELGECQRLARAAGVPVIVVFEGWDASGKGTVINRLTQAIDPRGFKVHSILPPNETERFHPWMWRFWNKLPAAGDWAIFDRSWYRRVLEDYLEKTDRASTRSCRPWTTSASSSSSLPTAAR